MEQEKMLWCIQKTTNPTETLPYYVKMGQRPKSVVDQWIREANKYNRIDLYQRSYLVYEEESKYTIAAWELNEQGLLRNNI